MYPIGRAFIGAVAAAALISCGGGDADNPPTLTLKERAIQEEAAAVAKIQSGPCTADSQCAYVTFFEPTYSCSQGTYVPYLKASKTAGRAIEAAQMQRQTALQARALEPPPNFACIASVDIVNSVCVQSRCSLTFGGPIITIEIPG